MMRRQWRPRICAVAVLVGMSACGRMSESTPKLSAELGDRIAEMHGLHELTLDRFFDAERRRIEDFLDREWTPLFLRNFLGTSGVLKDIAQAGRVSARDQSAIQTAAVRYLRDTTEAAVLTRDLTAAVDRSRGNEDVLVRQVVVRYVEDRQVEAAVTHLVALLRSEDPAVLVLEWAEDAQEQINLKRREMLAPLDEAERLAKSEVALAFSEMAQANGAITGRLEAAARISEQQDAVLKAFGVDSLAERVRRQLGSVSSAVGSAISMANASLNESQSAFEVEKTLKDALRTGLTEPAKR